MAYGERITTVTAPRSRTAGAAPDHARWTLTGRTSLLTAIGVWLSRSRTAVTAVLRVALRVLLLIAGLGLLSYAAWLWLGLAAGCAAGGVSCLVFEWAVKQPGAEARQR